jgi:uncharacterized damage-inducible protein DinB
MENNPQVVQILKEEFRRRVFEESFQRIFICLGQLTDEEIWNRPNRNLSSIGNLVLHLCGNARQWVVSGIGGEPDHRKRQDEFDMTGLVPKEELFIMMNDLKIKIESILDRVTEEELLRKRNVQVFEETGLSILVHVIEHFSYHTGQITWYTKYLKGIDTQYYKEKLEK